MEDGSRIMSHLRFASMSEVHTFVFFEGALLCFPSVILRYASTVGVLLDKALFFTSPPSMHLQS